MGGLFKACMAGYAEKSSTDQIEGWGQQVQPESKEGQLMSPPAASMSWE